MRFTGFLNHTSHNDVLSVVKALGKINETLILPLANLALARYVCFNQNNDATCCYIVYTLQLML